MICLNDIIQQFEDDARLEPYVALINDPSASKRHRWQAIRNYYKAREDEINEACRDGGWICPYHPGVDWLVYFSPIENEFWQALRAQTVPFFPQYPVGRRFVDFGNPYLRIALEADSHTWHDRDADKKRDAELAELGWRTYRVTSGELRRPSPEWSDLPHDEVEAKRIAEDWICGTVEGLLMSIAVLKHGKDIRRTMAARRLGAAETELLMQISLDRHQLSEPA
jgi:hypothetical protein